VLLGKGDARELAEEGHHARSPLLGQALADAHRELFASHREALAALDPQEPPQRLAEETVGGTGAQRIAPSDDDQH
jgi:hypothetical protein